MNDALSVRPSEYLQRTGNRWWWLIILPWLAAMVGWGLHRDFFYDEAYQLTHLLFLNPLISLRTYPDVGSYSLISPLFNLFLLVTNLPLEAIVDHPILLRWLPAGFSLASLWLIYRLGRECFSTGTGLIAASFLAGMVPFYSYSSQIRSYAPAIFLTILLLLQLWRYQKNGGVRPLSLAILAGGFSCYALMSNIYLLTAMASYFGIGWWWSRYQFRRQSFAGTDRITAAEVIQRQGKLFLAMVAAHILAVMCYLPAVSYYGYQKIFGHRVVLSAGIGKGYAMMALPGLILDGLSGRYLYPLLLGLGGMVWLYRRRFGPRRDSNTTAPSASLPGATMVSSPLLLLVAAWIGPELVSTMRGDHPALRVFLISMPPMSLLLATGVVRSLRLLADWPGSSLLAVGIRWLRERSPAWFLVGMFLYHGMMLAWELQIIRAANLTDLADGVITDTLYRNATMAAFEPSRIFAQAGALHARGEHLVLINPPVVTGLQGDKWSFRLYARHNGLGDRDDLADLDRILNTADAFYLVTSLAPRVLRLIQANKRSWTCDPVNPEASFFALWHCRQRPMVKDQDARPGHSP